MPSDSSPNFSSDRQNPFVIWPLPVNLFSTFPASQERSVIQLFCLTLPRRSICRDLLLPDQLNLLKWRFQFLSIPLCPWASYLIHVSYLSFRNVVLNVVFVKYQGACRTVSIKRSSSRVFYALCLSNSCPMFCVCLEWRLPWLPQG